MALGGRRLARILVTLVIIVGISVSIIGVHQYSRGKTLQLCKLILSRNPHPFPDFKLNQKAQITRNILIPTFSDAKLIFIIMFRKVLINWRSPLLIHTNKRFFLTPPKFDSNKNYYTILEVSQEANDSQLKKAYYRLAKDYHPDHNKGHQAKFKEINEAYEILSDPEERKKYDRTRDLFSFDLDGIESPQNMDYEEYKRRFYEMSPENQNRVKRKARNAILKIFFIFGSLFYITYSFAAWIFRSIRKTFFKNEEAAKQNPPNEPKQQLKTPQDLKAEQKSSTQNMPDHEKNSALLNVSQEKKEEKITPSSEGVIDDKIPDRKELKETKEANDTKSSLESFSETEEKSSTEEIKSQSKNSQIQESDKKFTLEKANQEVSPKQLMNEADTKGKDGQEAQQQVKVTHTDEQAEHKDKSFGQAQ